MFKLTAEVRSWNDKPNFVWPTTTSGTVRSIRVLRRDSIPENLAAAPTSTSTTIDNWIADTNGEAYHRPQRPQGESLAPHQGKKKRRQGQGPRVLEPAI